MLINFVEDEYDIRVKPLDIIYENFDALKNIESYILRSTSKE